MTLLGSVDIPFTKSTKIAVDATDTAGQAATVAQQATDTAGQAQATAQTASQTATQAAATAAGAAQAAQTAIATANGKNKAYYGATTPTSPQPGDIWFVEDGSNNVTAIKHYDGTQWVTDVDNTALEQQISAAQAAADNAATVGQAAQQTAADAEAKGDAAAKAAGEAKDAATKAKTDAANAVTQANNAVDKANDATANAQSAIDKAQEGFDTAQDALSKASTAENNAQDALNTAATAAQNAQDALSKAGAAVDTANNAKQVASDAATAASTAKTNAQTAMDSAKDAIDKANAANANANTREKSIVKSNAAPSNPATDQLWVDTSTTPQIMRRWNGTAWVDLSPTQASQIGAVSTTTYTTDITNINNTLSQKASATTVNTLTGRVDKAETAITQNANDIALKADKTYVDTIKQTVDSHSTSIKQNADAIALKASQSTVDALTGRVSTAEATLKTQADQISARITKTDADAKYATQTALTATANSLTSSISAVQTNLDNLQIGGRNFLLGTSTPKTVKGTGGTNECTTIYYLSTDFSNLVGKQLTMSYDLIADTTSGNVWVQWNNTPWGIYSLGAPSTTLKHYTRTFTLSDSGTATGIQIRLDNVTGNVTVSNFMLEISSKPSSWQPAPEDMATQSQISQLSDDINLRVQKGDVINQINVSTEGILIDGKKVHITGQTTIDNAVIKDAMIQGMTANKLTAGTIDANVITVKNINASNIVTGTLDASKATVANIDASKITTGTLNAARIAAGSIDASKLNVTSLSAISANIGNVTAGNISGVNINIGNGNFTVDTAGNLVAKNANITGTINATSGTFSGSVNVISTVTNPWGNYDTVKINPTYRFPIHIDDDESRHTYLSSGIVEIYYPAFSDTNTTSAKTTIEPSLITFSENDKTVSQITADAIYSIDYYNGQSTIISNGNAQFGNIAFNGAHSIISNDGGALFFTNANGDRIDINANWVRPNNMAFGYHTIASLDGKKLFFTNNTSNGKRIDIGIATLDYSGSLSKSSSEAIKANIMPMNFSALDEIMKTDFYSYNYKSDLEKGITKPSYGVVIGDKYRLSDKFLTQDTQAVSIDSMTAINSQAIKELYESMQKQNQSLILKIADLEARLAKLEA